MRWIKHLAYYSLMVLAGLLLSGCSLEVAQLVSHIDQVQKGTYAIPEMARSPCNLPESYVPDPKHPSHHPMRYLRVNVHFMNAADGRQNYRDRRALTYARQLIEAANEHLQDNQPMRLPPGNHTEVLPTRYQYVLWPSKGLEKDSAVYCHYDDRLFSFVSRGANRNNYDRSVFQQYGVGMDSIINIFIMPHHPDSVLSETYAVTSAGIALGSGLKIAGVYETRKPARAFRGLTNHEIGHVLGLRHSWNGNDGCADTPHNPNCWSVSEDPPCDSMASNNLMDYNKWQHAWTPCQIGKIHLNMSRLTSRVRNLMVPDWCTMDPAQTIYISDTVVWNGAKDLAGDLIIEDGGKLTINCRLSMPENGVIRVYPRGELILHDAHLHQSCNRSWQGIEVMRKGAQAGTVYHIGSSRLEQILNTTVQSDSSYQEITSPADFR